jgi:hypothetical protein
VTGSRPWGDYRSAAADHLRGASTLCPMRALFLFILLLAIIGGGMKLAGMKLPILDYPLGGPFAQPHIEYVQPSLGLP